MCRLGEMQRCCADRAWIVAYTLDAIATIALRRIAFPTSCGRRIRGRLYARHVTASMTHATIAVDSYGAPLNRMAVVRQRRHRADVVYERD